jgi:hypothetical protein
MLSAQFKPCFANLNATGTQVSMSVHSMFLAGQYVSRLPPAIFNGTFEGYTLTQ